VLALRRAPISVDVLVTRVRDVRLVGCLQAAVERRSLCAVRC
jgi:hypothetical protein